MAVLTAMPSEILRDILSHIRPDDLENFAQISRHVYASAAPFLLEHRKLCRSLYTFETDPGADHQIVESEYLKRLLVDPKIGRYVRNIKLSALCGDNVVQHEAPKFPEEDMRIISQLAGEAGFLDCIFSTSSDRISPSEWLRMARGVQQPVLLALLLMRFPHANYLVVDAGLLDPKYVFYDLLKRIASLRSTRPK